MITTLDDERQPDAEWSEHVSRKRPERNDGLFPIDRTLLGVEAPNAARSMQRSRIGGHQQPAQCRKALRIGSRNRERVAQAGNPLP